MHSPHEFRHNRPNIKHIMRPISEGDLKVLLFNKPFQVLCQFSDHEGKSTLAQYIHEPGVYAAGRLDFDSEGLLLLTGNGRLQHLLTDPRHKLPKTYWVQVEGDISDHALNQLSIGVELKDGKTRPARARKMDPPDNLWPRLPPVRFRAAIPTSWIEIILTEGRNRQVRRMTAAVGYPTLRLIRAAIGPWSLAGLNPGESRWAEAPPDIAARLSASPPPAPRKGPGTKRPQVRRQRSRAR